MMDPLDYNGMFANSDAPIWLLSPFDQQDATYLSSSRQMLETIVEETSEDEDIHHQSWSQFENVWSEESDTGSVIRIELHNDQDSISERDFACPPKRPRRDDLLIVDELPTSSSSATAPNSIIRKFPRNETLLIPELPTDSPGYRSKRFDELYSDSDTLSYNSLSRSSSLIQFESLERQMQGDLASTADSQIGHSSPSLATFETRGESNAAEGCIRRYESSDGRLHQTYYDLAKIEFNNDLVFTAKSDSESSDNSILSHEERIPKPPNLDRTIIEANRVGVARSASEQRACYKGKNSAENLSEDSGYGEYITALKIKSKSIPNFLRSNEKFYEEDEFFENHKSLELIYDGSSGGNARHEELTADSQRRYDPMATKIAAKLENNVDHSWYNDDVKNNIFREKTSSRSSSASPSRSTESSRSSTTSSSPPPSSPSRASTSSTASSSSSSEQRLSSSLPNVRAQFNHDSDTISWSFYDRDHASSHTGHDQYSLAFSDSDERLEQTQLRAIASVPKNLFLNDVAGNQFIRRKEQQQRQKSRAKFRPKCGNEDGGTSAARLLVDEDKDDEFMWNLKSPNFVRSQNRSSGGKKYLASKKLSASGAGTAQSYLNASYNNLTLLDYSGNRNSFTMSDYSGNSKRSSREFDLGKGNFLLDEISSHFDKNLSILSDRERDSDMISDFLRKERRKSDGAADEREELEDKSCQESVSKAKSEENLTTVQMRKGTVEAVNCLTDKDENPQRMGTSLETFDMNPTNLKTTYAESLESCTFDVEDQPNLDHSTPVKRGLVASTPNLNAFKSIRDDRMDEQLLTSSSAHNSMATIPGENKRLGILVSGSVGSRNSLGKGVSFCPIVSEISFCEQSSEEVPEDPESSQDSLAHQQQQPEPSVSASADQSIFRVSREQTDRERFVGDRNSAPPNPGGRVGVQQTTAKVLFVNSEIINNSAPTDEGRVQRCKSAGSEPAATTATISNESIVEECGLVRYGNGGGREDVEDLELDCDIPITVEMLASDLKNNQVNVPKLQSGDNGDEREGSQSPRSVGALVTQINNNNSSNNNSNKLNSNGNGNHQQLQYNQNNCRNNQKMPNIEVSAVSGNTKAVPATGTDLLSAKFKPKPDEKRHKNGFLSRFAGGFRFSLRRKKKPIVVDKNTNEQQINYSQQQQPLQQQQPSQPKQSQVLSANGGSKNSKSSSSKHTPDYVYIPLKGPSPNRQVISLETSVDDEPTSPCNDSADVVDASPERHLPLGAGTNNIDKNHVLLGKPPLPKQPPRVVGVCEKVRAGPTLLSPAQQYQATLNMYNSGVHSPNARHAQVFRSKSQPREIDERFLDGERSFYYNNHNQLIATMNGNGCTVPYVTESGDDTLADNIVAGVKTGGNGKATTLPLDASSSGKIGLIETNLDTHETVITGKTRSLMELGPQNRHGLLAGYPGRNLHHMHHHHNRHGNGTNIIDGAGSKRPHKSMEFLLDKENQKDILPPENELQKSHDSSAALSEHQLRVQASLQRLNIPDWFRQYNSTPKTETGYKLSNFNRKRASESGRWTGLNSKTTSLSSLGSQRSDRSPLMLSPSAHSHHGGQTGFSRWSTSHLNSTQTSPSVSTRGSFSRGAVINSSFISGHSVGGVSIRNSFRQPYLGWRSQEKLALSQPRTPHERLASTVLAQQSHQQSQHEQENIQDKQTHQGPPVTPEIQSSIKEVTSAIVHYVNDQTNRTSSRSRSTSPSSRKCWVESSFVGIKPVESPQTPVIDNSFNANAQTGTTGASLTSSTHSGTSDMLRMNGVGESTII